jgi:hypothetical protein
MIAAVVAAFHDRPAAEAAAERLRDSGIATGDVRLHASTSDVSNPGTIAADELVTGGLLGNGLRLLQELFGTHPKDSVATDYEEMVRREGTLLTVQLDSSDVAQQVARLLTAEYKVAKRPEGRVLVDYNQNAWGRTLASVYSVRPHPQACVSTPVTWKELEKGVRIEDFRLENVRDRFAKTGDLFKPLLQKSRRFDLGKYL